MELSVWQPAPLLPLSSAERVILEAVAASDSAEIPDRVRTHADIVLRAAEGGAGVDHGRDAGRQVDRLGGERQRGVAGGGGGVRPDTGAGTEPVHRHRPFAGAEPERGAGPRPRTGVGG